MDQAMIAQLHPGPAISGYPKSTAIEKIEEIEAHDRELYTGYLGPLNIEGESSLFINLRCMKVYRDSYDLFVGGGLTKDSDAHSEWEETELKAKTLLNILNKELAELDGDY